MPEALLAGSAADLLANFAPPTLFPAAPTHGREAAHVQDTMPGVVQRYAWYHARAKPGETETRRLIGAQALTAIGRWYNGQGANEALPAYGEV